MIDIHCHILPGVDDGSKNLEESIQMARVAQNEGITTIINTSHYHPTFEFEKGEKLKKIVEDFNSELKNQNIDVEVLIGNELYYTSDIIKEFNSLDFYTLNNSRYVLIEFPPTNFPDNIEDIVYEIKLRNYIPILAHVERYSEVIDNPNLIYNCIKEGALIQVNASSVVGKQGGEIKSTCNKLLDNNMVHFVATDAHGSDRRRPLLKESYDYIEKKLGKDRVDKIFLDNPRLLIEDKDINIGTPIKIEKKKSFIQKLFKR